MRPESDNRPMQRPPQPRAPKGWPPAIAAVVAAVLVLLVLPNPLRVPQNNPTASAEYAPVPGNQSSARNANFSQTNSADSAGLGSGGDGSGALPGRLPPPPPPQFRARQKNCYGNPPRQTEDPLSPPCVPFFDGDNGGATWNGVTATEIRVAYYNDFSVSGDLTQPYRPSDETGDQRQYYYQNHVKTVKALLRYFQRRYQTYGRTVRLVGYPSDGGLATTPNQRISETYSIKAEVDPFAIAVLIQNAQTVARPAAEYHMPVFGWNEDVPAEPYEQNAPYFWSFMPDQQTTAALSGSFICDKLKGRAARWSTDPTLKNLHRKFALVYPEKGQRGPFLIQMARLLVKETKKCGLDMIVRTFSGNGNEAQQQMTEFKRANVTTVICYCIPQLNELTVPQYQNSAEAIAYYPEWYFDDATKMDRALWQRNYGSQKVNSFGVSYLWRLPKFEQSYPYEAYLQEEPGSAPNLRFNFEIYHVFLNLFEAIQAAGPELTPDTIKRGMFTFRYTDPNNPWVPTGGYGPGGPSRYTFVDTGIGWWWDPHGTPPGATPGEGCIRVMYAGKRFYPGGWPAGDADMFDARDPCTEDERRQPADAPA
jgi:hypothetical protein